MAKEVKPSERDPGMRWRVLAWKGPPWQPGDPGKVELRNEGRFDELVVDDWFHLEQMDTYYWWMCVGGQHFDIYIPRKKGRPVQVIPRGETDPDRDIGRANLLGAFVDRWARLTMDELAAESQRLGLYDEQMRKACQVCDEEHPMLSDAEWDDAVESAMQSREGPMRTILPEDMVRFVTESNAIEGITREPTDEELEASALFLNREILTVSTVAEFVLVCEPGAQLRAMHGMDVYVGSHTPPPGGPAIYSNLAELMGEIIAGKLSPYRAHVLYETLHPFMDGNGRSGRILWAWQMVRKGWHPAEGLGFLHAFYYQSLESGRG